MICIMFVSFCLLVLNATPDSLELENGAHGTDVSVRIRLLSRETLL